MIHVRDAVYMMLHTVDSDATIGVRTELEVRNLE